MGGPKRISRRGRILSLNKLELRPGIRAGARRLRAPASGSELFRSDFTNGLPKIDLPIADEARNLADKYVGTETTATHLDGTFVPSSGHRPGLRFGDTPRDQTTVEYSNPENGQTYSEDFLRNVLSRYNSIGEIPNETIRRATVQYVRGLMEGLSELDPISGKTDDQRVISLNFIDLQEYGVDRITAFETLDRLGNLSNQFCPDLSPLQTIERLREIKTAVAKAKTGEELSNIFNDINTQHTTYLVQVIMKEVKLEDYYRATNPIDTIFGLRDKVDSIVEAKLEQYVNVDTVAELIINLSLANDPVIHSDLVVRIVDIDNHGGRFSLDQLPKPLLKVFIAEIKRAYSEIGFFAEIAGKYRVNDPVLDDEVGDRSLETNYREIRKSYYLARELTRAKEQIERAADYKTVINVLLNLPIDRMPISKSHSISTAEVMVIVDEIKRGYGSVQRLPEILGIRSKIKELSESPENAVTMSLDPLGENEAKQVYQSLREELFSNISRLIERHKDRNGLIAGSKKMYTPEEIIEITTDIIEGRKYPEFLPAAFRHEVDIHMREVISRTREDFPEMDLAVRGRINPFNGRPINPRDIFSRYELAIQLSRKAAGLPVFQPTSKRQINETTRLARFHFAETERERNHLDYDRARSLIKSHLLINPSSQLAANFWMRSTAEERSQAVEAVFGQFMHVELNTNGATTEGAKHFIEQLAKAGCHREIGLTMSMDGSRLRYKLSLGDLGSVRSDEGELVLYLAHTHPKHFKEKEADDSDGGRTVAFEANIEDHNWNFKNIMPSFRPVEGGLDGGDVIMMRQLASRYQHKVSLFHPSIQANEFYSNGTFQHVIFSSKGISLIQYQPGSERLKDKMTIYYAFHEGKKIGNYRDALNSAKKKINNFGKKYNVRVDFIEIDTEGLKDLHPIFFRRPR